MKSRRILILNERDPRHPRAGGAEIHVAELFGRLVARGHDVTHWSTGFGGAADSERIDGITVERKGPLFAYYAGLPGRLRAAAATQRFELVVECLNKLPYFASLWSRTPVLALCHHLFGTTAFGQVNPVVASGVWLAERGIPRFYRATPFLAISPSTRDDLVARGIAPEWIRVSLPGIAPTQRVVDVGPGRPMRFAFVGRLERYKRVDLVLDVVARLASRFPELEATVIGRGPQRAALEAHARRLGIAERVRFTGFVPDEERDRLLSEARVCLFPSEKEGFGLTVVEANALGTPVVASDVPGLRDSVRDGETGRLVPHADVEALCKATASLLEETPETLRMREAARRFAAGFDWTRATDDLEEILEDTFDGHAPRPSRGILQ